MKTLTLGVIAFALLSNLPASAGEHYRHHRYEGEVLNGRLHTYDFDGGVGYNASYGSDTGYGGGYYGGSASAMYTTGYSTSSVAATASSYAFGYIAPNR